MTIISWSQPFVPLCLYILCALRNRTTSLCSLSLTFKKVSVCPLPLRGSVVQKLIPTTSHKSQIIKNFHYLYLTKTPVINDSVVKINAVPSVANPSRRKPLPGHGCTAPCGLGVDGHLV